MQLLQNCIGPTILIGQQIQCLPDVGILSNYNQFGMFLIFEHVLIQYQGKAFPGQCLIVLK